MNGRLSSYQLNCEINIEKEATEMASRIMDRFRQKQNFRSCQKLSIKGDGFRSSEYQPRLTEVQSIRNGTNSIVYRNEIKYNLNIRQPHNNFEQIPKHIEIIKKSHNLQIQQSQDIKDNYQKSIKFNNTLESQYQSNKSNNTKLIKLMKA
ncbi:unnamed protein product [Paramecium pentaurelia]|uniref:Uncharacterized protein n=1 Tax=Paramecium pentaurelia TaxID=43138 RepID=A0A8S1U1K0_9CILI|nr:unnamed protein product [Paramecium pentaurelia]